MVQSQRGLSRGVSTGLRQGVTCTAILSLLGFCAACDLIQAQNNTSQILPPTQAAPSTKVVALGKLLPKGDVIKISVANAQDSRVNQILVKEGEWVKANQVIAILQGQDRVEQQFRDAKANVAIKQAQLLKIQQGDAKEGEIAAQRAVIAELEAHIRTETRQKEAVLASTEAALRNAKLKYQRNLALSKEGAISRSDLDNAIEEFDKAQAALLQNRAELENTTSTLQAQLARERANLEKLQEVRPVDVEIAKAELEQALIQVEQQKAELDNTQVRVPVAGQILRLNTRVGEQVNTQEGIAQLGQTNQMYVLAEVYETNIVKVRLGQRATLTSEYGGFQGEIRGKVERIGLQIGKSLLNQDQNNPTNDVNARVVEVTIRLDPEDSPKVAALTGMQVRVKIGVASSASSSSSKQEDRLRPG